MAKIDWSEVQSIVGMAGIEPDAEVACRLQVALDAVFEALDAANSPSGLAKPADTGYNEPAKEENNLF